MGLGDKKRKLKDPNAPPKEKKEKKEKKVKKDKEKGMKKEKGKKREKGLKRQGEEEEMQQGLGTGPLKKRRRWEMGVDGQGLGPWIAPGQGLGSGFGVDQPLQYPRGMTSGIDTWGRSNNNDDGYDEDSYGMFHHGFGRGFGSSDPDNEYGPAIAHCDFGSGGVGRSNSSLLSGGGLHSSGGSLGGGGLLGKRHRHGRSTISSFTDPYSEDGLHGMSEGSGCVSAMAGGSLHLLIQTASSAEPAFFDRCDMPFRYALSIHPLTQPLTPSHRHPRTDTPPHTPPHTPPLTQPLNIPLT